MKNKRGVTLIELLIAISLLVVIMTLGTGIYLSGTNLSADMVNTSQAHRTAQIAFMHVQKHVRESACINALTSTELHFNSFSGVSDIYSSPSIESKYEYDSTSSEMRFYPDRSDTSNYELVAAHISGCTFTEDPSGICVSVEITALDNNDTAESACTFSGDVQLMCGPSQPVFTI
jgi:prepilin-type N-terminal cleavage/methylation domain-containing protein